MSVNASVVLNDVNIKQGREGIHAFRIGSMNAGNNIPILESSSPVTIEYLEWATNSTSAQILIQHRKIDGDYESIGILQNDGSNTIGTTPKNIVDHDSSFFIVNSYSEGKYKFTLRNKLHFPNGVRVSVVNNSSSEINNAVRLFGVKY